MATETSEIVTNIIVSPADVWYAPVGEAIPDETSVAAGADWGGNWVKLGYTKTPLSALYEDEEFEVEIEQSLASVGRVRTKEKLELETTLAELYLDALALLTEGTNADTAAGVGQAGFEELDAGGEAYLTKRTFGFEGAYVDEDGATFPVRMFIHKATARLNGALQFAKADSTGIPLKIMALADMSKPVGERLFKMQKVLEPGT